MSAPSLSLAASHRERETPTPNLARNAAVRREWQEVP